MDNPLVIVGMACRVAGANSTSKLWDNILQKKDLRREMPPERFNVDAFYHPDRLNNGTVSRPVATEMDSQDNAATDQCAPWLLS